MMVVMVVACHCVCPAPALKSSVDSFTRTGGQSHGQKARALSCRRSPPVGVAAQSIVLPAAVS